MLDSGTLSQFPFLPHRPTHVYEREGNGEQNILWGWPWFLCTPMRPRHSQNRVNCCREQTLTVLTTQQNKGQGAVGGTRQYKWATQHDYTCELTSNGQNPLKQLLMYMQCDGLSKENDSSYRMSYSIILHIYLKDYNCLCYRTFL